MGERTIHSAKENMFKAVTNVIILAVALGGVIAKDCPDGWTVFHDSCYLSHHSVFDFREAEEKCEELGASLVHIETAAENTFLKSFLSDMKAHIHWIGLQDGVIEGVWKWYGTDTIASFTDWAPGQPNDGKGANCAVMYDGYGETWTDEPCSSRRYRPLCEKRIETTQIVG